MNDRQRFLETMTFGEPDRVPLWECAFWNETLDRWVSEGLPESVARPDDNDPFAIEKSFCSYFGFDRSFGTYFRGTVKVDLVGMYPGFESKVLLEENGIITEMDADGVISRWSRHGNSTRQFVRFPVENRQDFRNITKRFDPNSEERFFEGWKERVQALRADGAPISINAGGYYGFARQLMGLENLSYALCDDPELIEEIFEFRTEYVSRILEKLLEQIKPDFAEFWEDMAYKSGPLVSPMQYRKLALKHYRKITDLLHQHGVKVILLDSDGNINDLIPIWLDGGINCVWPLEIAAGMDPVSIRRKYGKNLGMIGGIDKRSLAAGKESIKKEVMGKVPYLLDTGGYIPTCDHAVPPDVSFENYMYYLDLLRGILHG